jgi:biotin carboxylase
MVIEANPRLAGGMLPTVIREATGVDLVDRLVRRATGRPVTASTRRDGHASIRFVVAEQTGELVAVDGLDAARAVPGVVAVTTTVSVGDRVKIAHAFTDRLGYVITAGPTAGATRRAADAGRDAVRVEIRPDEHTLEEGAA